MLDTYLSFLELGYYEVQFALEGLADEKVWQRPADGLLSIGELAGHIAYWEAVKLTGMYQQDEEPDLSLCKVSSPLIDRRFAYYPITLQNPPSEEQKAMTAAQVYAELMRVHTESVAYLKSQNPDLETPPPGWSPGWTYKEILKYATFHISYHTGQMYSARHLLGEQTPDN
jgi:hypothetical protein